MDFYVDTTVDSKKRLVISRFLLSYSPPCITYSNTSGLLK